MFQRIVIHLDGPTCKCKTKDLAWAIVPVGQQPTLRLSCNQCKQMLQIAPADFKAAIKLDEEYPETAPLVVNDGNLIDASKKFKKQ